MTNQVEKIRTGTTEHPGGRIYPVDPEAHAALRVFWQSQPCRNNNQRSDKRPGGRRINLTPEQLEDAYNRRMGGEAMASIAAGFGIHAMTLVLRLREAGYRLPGRHARLNTKTGNQE